MLILSSAGLPAAISKLVSERIALKQYGNAHKVFQAAIIISGSLGAVFSILLWVFGQQIANFANTPESYYCILTLSPTLFIVSIMSGFRGYFQGMNTMMPTAISQIVEQIFNAVFSVYLAYVFLDIGITVVGGKNIALGAAGGTAGTGIGAVAGLCIIMFSYFLIRPTIMKKIIKYEQPYEESHKQVGMELIQTAWPIIAGTAIFSITNLIDMNMVIKILQDTGFSRGESMELYGQLSGKYVTLTTLPVAISTALATAVLPSIAAAVRLGEFEQIKRKTHLTFRLSMIMTIPAAVGIGVLGDQIVHMLFPKATEGGMLVVVGAASILFLGLCQTATGILQGTGHIKIPVIGALLGAITKVILNYYLIRIPQLNILGAVLSTTGCYLVASVFNLIMLGRVTGVKYDMKRGFLKPLAGSAIMGVAVLTCYHMLYMIVPNNTLCTIVAIIIGVGIYGLAMIGIGGITKEDLNFLPMGKKMVTILRRYRLL